MGGREGWFYMIFFIDRICILKCFFSGGLFFKINVLRMLEGKNFGKRLKNGMFELCFECILSLI